jgi:trehalose-6-phosphatase
MSKSVPEVTLTKQYAEVCKDFEQFPGVSIEHGKHCLACWHFEESKNEKGLTFWRCELRLRDVKRQQYLIAQCEGQVTL